MSRAGAVRKKKARRKAIIITVVCVLAVAILGGAAYAMNFINSVNKNLHENVSPGLNDALVNDSANISDPFYMLLVGVDRSENRTSGTEAAEYADTFRTDSIILARVDPPNKTITLISIHRDIIVDLSEYGGTGQDKLNSAYVYGGQELMIQTVSQLAGVDISHYAEIDFDGFRAVVDTLGGVDVDVEMDFYDPELDCSFTAGYQTLDGEQALNYARARHAFDDIGDGDVYRAKHQRQILMAIAKKVLDSDAATITATVQTLSEYVTTDFDVNDLINLALEFRGIDVENNIYSAMTPTSGELIDGVWYEKLDEDEWLAMMDRVNRGDPPEGDSSSSSSSATTTTTTSATTSAAISSGSVTVKNGSGIAGAASEASDMLDTAGFTIDEVGDADSSDYASTLIVYDSSSDRALAEAVASTLGMGKVIQNDGSYSMSSNVLVVVGGDWT